jgi:hypothetical protein
MAIGFGIPSIIIALVGAYINYLALRWTILEQIRSGKKLFSLSTTSLGTMCALSLRSLTRVIAREYRR